MKTNLFRVKEKKDKKIIIEEERTKNPLLLFLIRHKNVILISLILLLICIALISMGLAFSLFRGSNDYDISYIEGSDKINSNNNPDINDDDIKENLLGEISRTLGIVLLKETFMSPQGDIISYYTDGTTVIIKASGEIYRVSPLENGNYGVNENGKIDSSARKILVTMTTTTLADGTIITYYSDGTARIEYKKQVYFIRDSNNIKLISGSTLNNLAPSGVAPTKEEEASTSNQRIQFTDNTNLIIIKNEQKIVNKNTKVSLTESGISYEEYNSFKVISEKTYTDGYTITHFENGSATIKDPNGNITYVQKSGDIVLKNKELYEIIPNEIGYSRGERNCSDKIKVTYFDNGAAVIIYPDGNRWYIEDNNDIIYDNNQNIISNPNYAIKQSEKTAITGEQVINFSNGKSQVINKDGSSYIIDTNKLTFKTDGTVDTGKDNNKNPSNNNSSGNSNNNNQSNNNEEENPTDGIEVSEAEHIYNDKKNIEDSKFIIKNNNNKNKILRITIEEINNYSKYNTIRLDPKYVKFQATVGNSYITATKLTANTWTSSDNRVNYVIYDGTIKAKATIDVAISLYVDYAELTNAEQNKGFMGTIKVYVSDK